MTLADIGSNILTLGILIGFFYIIYEGVKGNNVFAGIKEKMNNLKDKVKRDDRFKFNRSYR